MGNRFIGGRGAIAGRHNETANDQVRQLIRHRFPLFDGMARSADRQSIGQGSASLAVARHLLPAAAAIGRH